MLIGGHATSGAAHFLDLLDFDGAAVDATPSSPVKGVSTPRPCTESCRQLSLSGHRAPST